MGASNARGSCLIFEVNYTMTFNISEEHITKIGDQVIVTVESTDSSTTVSGTLTIPAHKSIELKGKIVNETDREWIVKLNADINGQRFVFVPKSESVNDGIS